MNFSSSHNLPRIILVDMNSFFASVEQQANPFWRGKPLGVCASLHPTSCLIAASKEAKKLGIKTGTLIWKAKKICPSIVLVESSPEKYREINRGLNKILSDYSRQIEAYSIDESFVDLSQSKLNPVAVGSEIKRRIKAELGEALTCSIGIAPNKFMAKLASDLDKPDGLTVIWRENLCQIYRNLRLSDLWGIARGWERRLARLGIYSPLELMDYPLANLVAAFGKPGFYLWQRVNGLEDDQVNAADEAPKTFGHSWVLNFRTTDKRRLAPAVLRLAEKAARRMRREGFVASGIYLSVRLADGTGFGQSKKLARTVETGSELFEQAQLIWRAWDFSTAVVHIAVGFFGLVNYHEQLDLFGSARRLSAPLDAINDKYGEFTIRPALLAKTGDYAPDAIAFGR